VGSAAARIYTSVLGDSQVPLFGLRAWVFVRVKVCLLQIQGNLERDSTLREIRRRYRIPTCVPACFIL